MRGNLLQQPSETTIATNEDSRWGGEDGGGEGGGRNALH